MDHTHLGRVAGGSLADLSSDFWTHHSVGLRIGVVSRYLPSGFALTHRASGLVASGVVVVLWDQKPGREHLMSELECTHCLHMIASAGNVEICGNQVASNIQYSG